MDLAKWCPDTTNRDPKEFPNPDEFRLGRDLPSHVGFGAGIHYRLGAPLVRAGDEVTLDTLLDRFSTTFGSRISIGIGCSHVSDIDVYHFLFDFEDDKVRKLKRIPRFLLREDILCAGWVGASYAWGGFLDPPPQDERGRLRKISPRGPSKWSKP